MLIAPMVIGNSVQAQNLSTCDESRSEAKSECIVQVLYSYDVLLAFSMARPALVSLEAISPPNFIIMYKYIAGLIVERRNVAAE